MGKCGANTTQVRPGIVKYLDGRPKPYLARFRDRDGKQKKKWFALLRDAVAWHENSTASVKTGEYVDPQRGKATLGALIDEWLASKVNLKPSTRAGYESVIKMQVRPRWGNVRVDRVEHEDIVKWIAAMVASKLSAARVRHAHTILAQTLSYAVKAKRLVVNPAKDVTLPRKPERLITSMTHDEVAQLAAACGEIGRGLRKDDDGDDELFVLTLAYGGMRFGEGAALRVSSLRPERRRIIVSESVTEVMGRAEWSDTKTHAQRAVALPGWLVDLLIEHARGKRPDELLFPSPRGAVLRNNNFRRDIFDPARKAAGLEWVTPKVFRNTAASLAISDGANVKAVQRQLGHASAAVTLDIYATLFEDDLDEVAESMGAKGLAARAKIAAPSSRPSGDSHETEDRMHAV
jgi:integrase